MLSTKPDLYSMPPGLKWKNTSMSVAAPASRKAIWLLNERCRHFVMYLFLFGLFSLALVRSCEIERAPCGPFTIGVSAIGGCDYIAGQEHF